MAFSEHIKSLLREHGRAFLPGLGGFVKEYLPARLDRKRDLFLPPTSTISFNSSLAKEDGVLVERLVEEEGIPFEKARERVREKVNEWQKEIREKKRLELEGIGILYRDEEASLRFEPDPDPELEPSAYGLGAFYANRVDRQDDPADAYSNIPEEEESIETPEKGEEKKKWSWTKAAAVFIPLSILLGLGALLRMNGTPLSAEFLDPFASRSKGATIYQPRDKAMDTIAFDRVEKHKMPSPPFHFELKEGGPRYMVVSEKALRKAEEKKEGRAWSVVGGCFEVKANAEERVKELSGKGFSAKILDQRRRGLYVVVFDRYAERNKALEGLRKARRIMRDAWLLHSP